MVNDTKNSPPPLSGLIGFAILALCIVGLLAVVLAFLAAGRNDYMGSGVLLVAAALSFGLLLNGVVRT